MEVWSWGTTSEEGWWREGGGGGRDWPLLKTMEREGRRWEAGKKMLGRSEGEIRAGNEREGGGSLMEGG